MRTLEINKTDVWYVNPIGEVDVLDEDGNYTGEKELNYGDPIKTKLSLYPATGKVLENTFGLTSKVEFITTSNLEFTKQTLLFTSEPTSDIANTYDFKIGEILPSLNHYQYGLIGKV